MVGSGKGGTALVGVGLGVAVGTIVGVEAGGIGVGLGVAAGGGGAEVGGTGVGLGVAVGGGGVGVGIGVGDGVGVGVVGGVGVGVAVGTGAAEMMSVTGTVCGSFVARLAEIVTPPVCVPASRPDMSTDTVIRLRSFVASDSPSLGLARSQATSVVIVNRSSLRFFDVETRSVCGSGFSPSSIALYVSASGENAITGRVEALPPPPPLVGVGVNGCCSSTIVLTSAILSSISESISSDVTLALLVMVSATPGITTMIAVAVSPTPNTSRLHVTTPSNSSHSNKTDATELKAVLSGRLSVKTTFVAGPVPLLVTSRL